MNDFKGIWIPAAVWLEKDLPLIEKLFLVQINHLDNKDGCFASNGYFSDFFGVSKSRCTQIIKSLESKSFISISLIYDGKVIAKRVLNLLSRGSKLFKQGSKNIKSGYLKNCEGKNTNIKTLNEKESVHTPEEIEISNPKKQDSEEKEKSSAKKEKEPVEVPPTDYGYQSRKKKLAKSKGKSWSQLDINLHSYKDNLPQEWSSDFTETVIDFWYYLEEKKGVNWGTVRTIKGQVEAIENWRLKYNEQQITQSIKECIERGNSQYNPQWTINRIKKEQDEQQKRANDGQPKSKFGKFGASHLSNGNQHG